MNDLKFAVRQLIKNPGFTVAAVLTFALGIMASTAVFSFLNALLFRPLPYRDPERLVRIHATHGGEITQISRAELLDILERSAMFEDIAAYAEGLYNASSDDQRPEELPALIVTHNLWQVLGVPIALGHAWEPSADLERGFNVVLSHSLWQRRLGGQTNVLGSKLTLDAAPFYVIHGVAPPGFDFPARVDIFRSMGIRAFERKREQRNVFGIGRLKQGISQAQAQRALSALARVLKQEFPETNHGFGLGMEPLRQVYVGKVRPYLWLLCWGVALVLVLATANIANLLLARALSREREMGVRMALGAGRRRLITQLLAESGLLALLGGIAGVALAFGLVPLLASAIPKDLPSWIHVTVDGRVLCFTCLVAILIGLIVGLVPARQIFRANLSECLKEKARSPGTSLRGEQFRRWLVMAEITAAGVLLIGAGLTVRSFQRLRRADLGFKSENLFTFRVALGWRAYTNQMAITRFYQTVLEKLAMEPDVSAVALNSHTPFSRSPSTQSYTLEGQNILEQERNPWLNEQRVNPGYFRAMNIPVLRGREFLDQDRQGALLAALVSERTASRLWPGQDPIGKRLKMGGPASTNEWLSVVGIVPNVKLAGAIEDNEITIYLSYWQFAEGNGTLIARTTIPPVDFTKRASRIVESVDPNQSAFDWAIMEERVRASVWSHQLASNLFALFAALSLVLAAVGIYGIMSYMVGQRTREIGVRLALGATSGAVMRQVVAEGMKLVLIGVAIGLPVAFGATHWTAHLIYGLSATDPAVFTGTPVLLAVIALISCALPALRASRVDPMKALRNE